MSATLAAPMPAAISVVRTSAWPGPAGAVSGNRRGDEGRDDRGVGQNLFGAVLVLRFRRRRRRSDGLIGKRGRVQECRA